MKSEKELFEKWFKKNFKDLYEAVLCGDLVAKNYKKAMYKGWKASINRKGCKLVPVDADGDMLIINGLSIHIKQAGNGRVFCDITIDGNLVSQKNSMEDAVNFCKGYNYDAN